MKAFIVLFLGLFAISMMTRCPKQSQNQESYAVGVGRAQVDAKIDLTDQLNPAILPDVLRDVFASIEVKEKPDAKKFQQLVVQRFSQAVMDNPEVNYRVDMNEDGTIDPLMIVPESVEGEGAIYSLRVPDPGSYPSDPQGNADWDRIANDESIELVEVGVTFDEINKQVAVSATPNGHVYENSGHDAHYTQNYGYHHHSWIETYFQYRLFSMVLFGPYGWGFGPWYGGYYGGFYRPYSTMARARTVTPGKYSNAPRSNQAMKTASGKTMKGTRAASRRSMPASIKQMKSRRAMAVRQQRYTGRRSGGFGSGGQRSMAQRRSGGFGSSGGRRSGGFGRSRSRSFGGGGMRGGFGK